MRNCNTLRWMTKMNVRIESNVIRKLIFEYFEFHEIAVYSCVVKNTQLDDILYKNYKNDQFMKNQFLECARLCWRDGLALLWGCYLNYSEQALIEIMPIISEKGDGNLLTEIRSLLKDSSSIYDINYRDCLTNASGAGNIQIMRLIKKWVNNDHYLSSLEAFLAAAENKKLSSMEEIKSWKDDNRERWDFYEICDIAVLISRKGYLDIMKQFCEWYGGDQELISHWPKIEYKFKMADIILIGILKSRNFNMANIILTKLSLYHDKKQMLSNVLSWFIKRREDGDLAEWCIINGGKLSDNEMTLFESGYYKY
jgi:hypothetical protein